MQVKILCPHCERVTELDASKIPEKQVTFSCPGCQGKVPVDGSKLQRTPAEAEEPPIVAEQDNVDERQLLAHLELPEGASMPPGIIISDDPECTDKLRQVLGELDCRLRDCASAADARAQITVNLPPLMIYVAGAVTPPPFEPIEAIVGLPPADRRRTFIVLVGENLNTLDGNAAFFHGVDVVLAKKDVALADKVLFSALQFRDRLCGPFYEALAAVEGR